MRHVAAAARPTKIAIVCLASALMCFSSPADAASFNCAPYYKSRKCPEIVICDTGALSQLDDEVNDRYVSLMGVLTSREGRQLRNSQRNWLDGRNQCGCDASCIESYYRSRINDLDTGSYD